MQEEEKKIMAWMAFFIGNCIWYLNEQPKPGGYFITRGNLPFKNKEIRQDDVSRWYKYFQ